MNLKITKFDELMRNLLTTANLEKSLSLIVRDITQEFEFQSLGIYTFDDQNDVHLQISRNLSHSFRKSRNFQPDAFFMKKLNLMQVFDLDQPDMIKFEYDYKHLIVTPLQFDNTLLGFMFIDKEDGHFDLDEMYKFEMFGGLVSLIIHIQNQKHTIEKLSQIDENTGLYTMKAFIERAQLIFTRSVRYGRNITLIILQISEYKKMIRTNGKDETKVYVNKIANILKTRLRSFEIIGYRYPDTFAVLLSETDKEQNMHIVRRLTQDILDISPSLKKDYFSWGISSSLQNCDCMETLLNNTETAAFEASRKEKHIVFTEEL